MSKSADYEEDEAEDEDKGKKPRPIENSMFYGISAKRYAIYDYDPVTDKIDIRKYSLHGLGHLVGLNKNWSGRTSYA